MNMLLTVSALALAAMDPEHMHGHSPQLGKLTFETTCSPAAHALFHQGVAWLHSFEYQRAEQSFSEAAAADPRCGIADWGVAMSYYPLWDGPTADELEKGKSAIETAKAAGGCRHDGKERRLTSGGQKRAAGRGKPRQRATLTLRAP